MFIDRSSHFSVPWKKYKNIVQGKIASTCLHSLSDTGHFHCVVVSITYRIRPGTSNFIQ
jgi:hypothetical protein